jgi:tetratricopeptide (TPR) repeat protein
LGVAFHRLSEDERALSCYEAALRIDPIYAEAHYFRANILYSQGNVHEAIAGYRIAIGLQPELIEAHQKLVPEDRLTDYSPSPAEMYWIAKPAHRILDLNKSLETNPGQASLFKERAAEYYRLRNYVQAIADYSSFLEIHPDEADVFHFRGVAYEQIGQFDRALEDYQRAIVISPQLTDMYINRGVTFGKKGNFRQSIASFTESIRLAPKNPIGYFNRGMSYFQQGDVESAIDDFSNVIRLAPADETAYYWRGISNEEAGRQREAIADYRQFLALSQDANAREEIEQKLGQWNVGKPDSASSLTAVSSDRQKTNQVPSEESDQNLDLYGLIVALGERALNSTWFGSGVNCYGEKAEELYASTDQNKPIEGHYLFHITSGIRQTIEGDFQAFDPGATSPWMFIRAWDGSGSTLRQTTPKSRRN